MRVEYERGPDGRKLVASMDDENGGLGSWRDCFLIESMISALMGQRGRGAVNVEETQRH
jgi:hypothetical protein